MGELVAFWRAEYEIPLGHTAVWHGESPFALLLSTGTWPGDLSSVFGIHGQMTHPKVQKTISDMIPKIKSAGKQVGTLVFDGESAKKWIGEGVNCLVNSTNRFLSSGTTSYLEEVRKYIK